MTSKTILRCSSFAHIGQDWANSVKGPPWGMVLPFGRCHGPSGSNNSFSVFRSPSFSAAKARLTTDLFSSMVDSCRADWATAAAEQRTMRLAQSNLRIEDFLQGWPARFRFFCLTNGGLRQLLIRTGGIANPVGCALSLARHPACAEIFGEGIV